MASKKLPQKAVLSSKTNTKSQPETDFLLKSEDSVSPEKFDETIASIFSSKRHTGQFSDKLRTSELDLLEVKKSEEILSKQDDDNKWTDCLVHDIDADFDSSDDIMEWPTDYDEKDDKF
ncbi:MAG: hypothetical protein HY819_18215 [Acidobacteria bacterium]|nr:hypothetical protein [Acidobacteriota bacterium]